MQSLNLKVEEPKTVIQPETEETRGCDSRQLQRHRRVCLPLGYSL